VRGGTRRPAPDQAGSQRVEGAAMISPPRRRLKGGRIMDKSRAYARAG
jgi:hypothetical protein